MAKVSAEKINPIDYIYPQELFSITAESYPTEEIFQLNLNALKQCNSPLAKQLEGYKLPQHYHPAISCDGYFSYKINSPDGKSQWLGKRSSAYNAALTDYNRLELKNSNAAVNGLGDGYIIAEILKNARPFQAIFALENDIAVIKANLCIHDFSKAIESGQLVIISGDDLFNSLSEFLVENFGYQLIDKALYCHSITEQQNNQFNLQLSAAVEKAINIIAAHTKQIQQDTSTLNASEVTETTLKQISISSLPSGNSSNDIRLTESIITGIKNKGINTHLNLFDSPRHATNFSQLDLINKQKPAAILLVNSLRSMTSYMLPENIPVISILPELTEKLALDLKEDAISTNDIIACKKECFKPLEKQKNQHKQVAIGKIVDTNLYYPLCDSDRVELLSKYDMPQIDPVIFISKRNPLDLDHYKIKLHSYVNLLKYACDSVIDNPSSYNSSLSRVYFDKAYKKSSAKISEQETRDTLLNIFSLLADSCLQDNYGNALIKDSIPLSVFHKSDFIPDNIKIFSSQDDIPKQWEKSNLIPHLKAEIMESKQLNIIFNSAKIAVFSHADGKITQDMLNAAATGMLVLTKSHPKDNQNGGLKDVLTPGSEIITYTTGQDLCRKVRLYLDNPDKRQTIVDNARAKIKENYNIEIFCQSIIDALIS